MLMVGRADAGVVDSRLADALRGASADREFPVIIHLADKADIKSVRNSDRSRHRAAILTRLRDNARNSQRSVQTFLNANYAKHITPLWIVNGIAVTAGPALIEKLAAMPGFESITLDATLNAPITEYSPAAGSWGLSAIGAPSLWSLGYTGHGVVVATLDTGVDGSHPDLAGRWRGGTNSWFDPHGQHLSPHDASGHGTQVMGIILGANSDGTSTGVAPGARWIAAKIFNDAGDANESDIHKCFQWVLDPDGDPNTDDAPDIVNNSWGYEQNTNQCLNYFVQDVNVLRSAGIAVVFAAGNAGPNASTSVSPANYENAFSVGAVRDTLSIYLYSSRGPSACDSDIYPKVVAPGVGVRSCDLYGGYAYVDGSSFAAPHVSGAMAILLSAFPNLSDAQMESALKNSTVDLGGVGPDNSYGFGLLDVAAAYQLLTGPLPNIPPAAVDDYSVINANTAVLINVLANDTDPDNAIDPATVMVVGEPNDGTAGVNSLTAQLPTHQPRDLAELIALPTRLRMLTALFLTRQQL